MPLGLSMRATFAALLWQAAKPDGLKEDSAAGSDADVPSIDFTAGVAEEPLSAPKGPDSEGQLPRFCAISRSRNQKTLDLY